MKLYIIEITSNLRNHFHKVVVFIIFMVGLLV